MKDVEKLKDVDIRPVLFEYYDNMGLRQRIIEEFPLGNTRADALLIRDCLVGLEIKSDRDSLQRLERQVKGYQRYCDANYIVVGTKYLKKVMEEVPEKWGIIHVFRSESEGEVIEFVREAVRNPRSRIKTQMSLLWRSELIRIVRKYQLGGVTTRNKKQLSNLIVEKLSLELVREELCNSLIEREYNTRT